ncbi:MAG: T9SS type A sorting domain-containing protein [candidate division Zixibacteria bacterium]|nr:T9SS type A sorting domain-containing protein [candidate division Zixibacteria bacterium]
MKTKTAILFFCVCLIAGIISANDVLTIKRIEHIPPSDGEISERPAVFWGRAKENFLNLERSKPYGLPTKALAADQTDTIHIIAFRVGFAYETTDDPATTGRGVFDTRDSATFVTEEGHWLDPAPHNKHYFESHLRSLNQYYNVVSNGRLHLEYEVWPQGDGSGTDTSFYQLEKPMAFYGGEPVENYLAIFFHDGLNKAYEQDGTNFSFTDDNGNKKAIILFHAGADRQTDLSFSATPTPRDLFTAFTTYDGTSRVFLGNDTITEGIIMPETMAQDNRVTVMNAVMAHEFGHQLGLVDLYNTGSNPFLSQMGDFALMDNNGMNTAAYIDEYGVGAFGTVPIFPSAWSRAYLGFEEVVEYREGMSIELAAVKMEEGGIKIVKIPISATEYYLIENRRSDLDGNLGGLRVDSTSNVVLWPAIRQDIIDGDSIISITVPVREYDVYLPENASGLAVWHVDEAVAAMDYYPFDLHRNNFESNTLQWDPNRRFISLVEADGIIDFGGNYVRGFGQAKDLFYQGNNSSFTSYTNPATRSNDGGYSHYNITNISAPGMTMTFDLSRNKFADNFPRRMSFPDKPDLSPVAADLDNDGRDEIILVSKDKLLVVTTGGLDYMDPAGELDDLDTIFSAIDINTDSNILRPSDTSYAPMPIFAQILFGSITTMPVITEINDSTKTVTVGTDNGWVYSYLPYSTITSSPGKYRARLFAVRSTPDAGGVTAIIPDSEKKLLHVLYDDGSFVSAPWDTSGTLFDITHTFEGKFKGFCQYNRGLALLFERDTESILYMTNSVSMAGIADSLLADSVILSSTGFYSPVASDFDRDGNDEIVLLSAQGLISAYSFLPSEISRFDAIDIDIRDTATSSPVVCDYTENGVPEIFVSGTNRIYGFDRSGYELDDFPLLIDGSRPEQLIVTSPLVSDVNGDNIIDFSVISFDSIPRERSILAYYYKFPDIINYPDDSIKVDTTIHYSYYNYFSNLYVASPGVSRNPEYPVPVGIFGLRSIGDTTIGIGSPLHAKNGNTGLLVTAGANGWIDAWECDYSEDKALWTMKGRTASGAGYLPLDSLGLELAKSEFVPEANFYNYPNPATGNRTTIRFYVSKPAEISIEIYDALGDKVKQFSRHVPDGNRVEEITWDLDGVASGVYHCRLEANATDGSESKVAFKSIAIVK